MYMYVDEYFFIILLENGTNLKQIFGIKSDVQ